MNVTFILPGYPLEPNGGTKIVYEYANRLQERGHQVTVVHPVTLGPARTRFKRVKAMAGPPYVRIRYHGRVSWFAVRRDVRMVTVPDLRERFVPPGDAIFATSWQTAPWVNTYASDKGRKYYLIQHYETWGGPKGEVDSTWRLPLHKVVIARWLEEVAATLHAADRTTYVPNGFDLKHFRMLTDASNRDRNRVGMLYHVYDWKGASDGIAALVQVHAERPNLRPVFFGTPVRPNHLPSWIEYRRLPGPAELVRLYNECSIFLHPSWAEGSPLPPAEAMACGCALVAAANGGVCQYADHEETALLAPIKDPRSLAEQLLRAMDDDALRLRLAKAGHARIQTFTWDRAVDRMGDLLQEKYAEANA